MEKRQRGIYYGWYMVALLFHTLIHTGGNGFYAFSVYVPRLIETFGCSTSGLMLAAALWAVVFGISNPLVGALIHKWGVRRVFISGVVCAGLSMLLMSFATRLWHIYLLNLLYGFVGAATILVPSQTLITAWFNRRRGLAMALTLMGLGVGGFIVPQLVAWLMREFGWRESMRIGAVINYLIVLPPLLLFLKNSPADMGLPVDGLTGKSETTASAQTSGMSIHAAVRTSAFWILVVLFVLQLFVMSGIQMNIQNFAEKQMGYSLLAATRFMAFALLITLPARFVFGWLCDRMNPKYLVGATGLFLMGGAFVLRYFVIQLGWVEDYRAIWLFAIFQGSGIAGSAIVLPILVGRIFGEREFPRIMGMVMGGFALGVILGPVSMGRIFDLTGNYAGAFGIAMIVSLGIAIMAIFLRSGSASVGKLPA